jgi:hypothetical protein
MRNLPLIAFFSLIILSACRKNDYTILESHDSNQEYNVSFTTLNTGKSGSTPKTLNDAKPEYTRIYNLDNGGILVSSSKVNNKLAAGNYVAIFVYSNTFFSRVYGLGGSTEGFSFDNSFFDTRLSVATQGLPIDDIFYKKVYFKVKHKDVSQIVELGRIVADLEVIIGDEMPAVVARLELSVNDQAIFKFNNDSRESPIDKIKNFLPTEKVLNAYVLGQGSRAVTIKAYDATGGVLKEKRMMATFTEGKKTVVNVNLFSDTTTPFALATY